MGIIAKLLGKAPQEETARVGGMEDFMTLIRVYYQAVMAMQMGISNLAVLPDLRIFKQTLHVPTVNNKLGIGERKRCRTMLMDVYGMEDNFFKEIDASIKRNCRNVNDIKNYLLMFDVPQGIARHDRQNHTPDHDQQRLARRQRTTHLRQHPSISNAFRLQRSVDDRICPPHRPFGQERA